MMFVNEYMENNLKVIVKNYFQKQNIQENVHRLHMQVKFRNIVCILKNK